MAGESGDESGDEGYHFTNTDLADQGNEEDDDEDDEVDEEEYVIGSGGGGESSEEVSGGGGRVGYGKSSRDTTLVGYGKGSRDPTLVGHGKGSRDPTLVGHGEGSRAAKRLRPTSQGSTAAAVPINFSRIRNLAAHAWPAGEAAPAVVECAVEAGEVRNGNSPREHL
jgi:hypothetical protein